MCVCGCGCADNGDKGGHFNWGPGHHCHHNLIVGQLFLGPSFDASVFHTVIQGQTNLKVERNWCLGPSLITCVRLDTSSTTTTPGMYTQIRHNVHFGLGITLKGYNQTCEHNTGEKLTVVEDWGAISDHNTYSCELALALPPGSPLASHTSHVSRLTSLTRCACVADIRYNAHTETTARGSTRADGGIPGYSSMNTCSDITICNSRNATRWLTPLWMAKQFTESRQVNITRGVEGELNGPTWSSTVDTGGNEGDGVVDSSSLSSLFPYQVATPMAKGLNFTPKANGRLVLQDQDGPADGEIYDYTDTKVVPKVFDGYLGAYSPNDTSPYYPGCCGRGAKSSRAFPDLPTMVPTSAPTPAPSSTPLPSSRPSPLPTALPTLSLEPSNAPTPAPSVSPLPTPVPTPAPSVDVRDFNVSWSLIDDTFTNSNNDNTYGTNSNIKLKTKASGSRVFVGLLRFQLDDSRLAALVSKGYGLNISDVTLWLYSTKTQKDTTVW